MEPQQARYIAAFAYILGRAAHADLTISEDETGEMEQIVMKYGQLPEEQAIVVVQIAKTQNLLFGHTENYLVTRQFNQLNTPILGMVENMSYYLCPHCGERDEIFGTGGGIRISQEMDIPFLGEIPLSTSIREYSDQGKPVVMADADSEQAKAFVQVAESLAAQISIHAMSGAFEQDIKVSF